MQQLTSILVVVSRTAADRPLLEKAVRLARSTGAHLHLFSCDAVLARILLRAYDSAEAEKSWHLCLQEHLAYLKSLRATVDAAGVRFSLDAACHTPLYEGINRKVREVNPDLVLKCPAGLHPLRRFTLDPNDWHLVRSCPSSLMLVRPRPWRALPRLAALVNLADEQSPRLPGVIVHAGEYLALGCRGELDVIFSESSTQEPGRAQRQEALHGLCREFHLPREHAYVLDGCPDETLPEFTARQDYDALLLGALTHRSALAALAGALTGKLADRLECDFILIKEPGRATQELGFTEKLQESASGQDIRLTPVAATRNHKGPGILWQTLFGD